MTKVLIDSDFCKGCGLCVSACSENILKLDENQISAKGFHPAVCTNPDKCTICLNCVTMCPDVAIIVEKESKGR